MSVAMEDWPRRHRITVDEYLRMAESGSFAPDARVELIDGEIIHVPPIGPSHSAVVSRLARLFFQSIPAQGHVRVQLPVRLDRYSEPQPDLALLRARDDDYSRSHPSPSDVLLLIEVSHSSLTFDRNVKIPLYARHRIPVDAASRRRGGLEGSSPTGLILVSPSKRVPVANVLVEIFASGSSGF